MVHGYHVVFGTYGFWLPNDPHGSLSRVVGADNLRQFGPATRGVDRPLLSDVEKRKRREAKQHLQYPEVWLSGVQAREVGRGFTEAIRKSRLTVWACSILPQHVHLVIARHRFKVEYVIGLFKGEATKALKRAGLHPLAEYHDRKGEIPTPWNTKSFRRYLESESDIEDAIAYVVENPVKENKPAQSWPFVTAFAGLDVGWTTYQ
jgi:REP element-mobilizing transposase RayT